MRNSWYGPTAQMKRIGHVFEPFIETAPVISTPYKAKTTITHAFDANLNFLCGKKQDSVNVYFDDNESVSCNDCQKLDKRNLMY